MTELIATRFQFEGQLLTMKSGQYSNGRTALAMFLEGTPVPYCVLTVNLPLDDLKADEFFVKTWSENEAITDALRSTGIFTDTGRRVKTGHVHAEVWKFATLVKSVPLERPIPFAGE